MGMNKVVKNLIISQAVIRFDIHKTDFKSNSKTWQTSIPLSFPLWGITSLSSVIPLFSFLHLVTTPFISAPVHTFSTWDDHSLPHTPTPLWIKASLLFAVCSSLICRLPPRSVVFHPCCRYSLHSWRLYHLPPLFSPHSRRHTIIWFFDLKLNWSHFACLEQ